MLPIVILAIVFLALIMFNRRSRDRASRADATRRERLRPGTEVMTTSGLYATVVAVESERDTAVLSIAPGVEVTWAIAALREANELPAQYRGAVDPAEGPTVHPAVDPAVHPAVHPAVDPAVGPPAPAGDSHQVPPSGPDQANS